MPRTQQSVLAFAKHRMGTAVTAEQEQNAASNLTILGIGQNPEVYLRDLPSGTILVKHYYHVNNENNYLGPHVLIWVNRKDFHLLADRPERFMINSEGALIHMTSTHGFPIAHSSEFLCRAEADQDYEIMAYRCNNPQFAEHMVTIAVASINKTCYRPQTGAVDIKGSTISSLDNAYLTINPMTFPTGPVEGAMDCIQFVEVCRQHAEAAMQKQWCVLSSLKNLPSVDAALLHNGLAASSYFEVPTKCFKPEVNRAALRQQKAIINQFNQTSSTDGCGMKRGEVVTIINLSESTDLNNQTGVLFGYDATKPRWVVLIGNDFKSLKAANLKSTTSNFNYYKLIAFTLLACLGIFALYQFMNHGRSVVIPAGNDDVGLPDNSPTSDFWQEAPAPESHAQTNGQLPPSPVTHLSL